MKMRLKFVLLPRGARKTMLKFNIYVLKPLPCAAPRTGHTPHTVTATPAERGLKEPAPLPRRPPQLAASPAPRQLL